MALDHAKRARSSVVWLAGLAAVLWAPAEAFGFLGAFPPLAALAAVDRFTLLALFAALLALRVLWTDLRPVVRRRFSSQPSEEDLRTVGTACLALASEIALEVMDRTRSAPRDRVASGLDDRAQRRAMDRSSAYDWESVQIYSERFSGRVSEAFRGLRGLGVSLPPLEASPLLPHWMEDIARFLGGAGRALAAGDVGRVDELAAALMREIREQRVPEA